MTTPMGPQVMTVQIVKAGASFAGTVTGEMGVQEINGKIDGDTLTWTLSLSQPVAIKLSFEATVAGDTMSGNVKLGVFGNAPLSGKRL